MTSAPISSWKSTRCCSNSWRLINIWNLPHVPTPTAKARGKRKSWLPAALKPRKFLRKQIFSISAGAQECQERDGENSFECQDEMPFDSRNSPSACHLEG